MKWKIWHWILISMIPALLGCFDYIQNGTTSKGLLMWMIAWMIMFYLWMFKGYYFKEEIINK